MERSKKEKKLQRRLIPLNIVVCIISLVAALSLFLAPIITVDFGKILRDDATMEFVDDMIGSSVDGDLEGAEESGIDYKPVVTKLVKNILGKAEGKISISAVSAYRVMTAGENKTQVVLDDLFFGDKALATKLINSVVDGVAGLFETDEGKELLEDALVSAMAGMLTENVEDEYAQQITKSVKDIVGIFNELGDEDKVPDGDVTEVANKLVDKVDELLGENVYVSEEDRQEFVKQLQEIYNDTKAELGEGEKVSIESIICVTISKNVNLDELNIEELLSGILGDNGGKNNSESAVHIKAVEEEVGNPEEGEGGESGGKVVTNYNDFLLAMGFDKDAKERLKETMRTSLNDALNKMLDDNGISDYLGYYGYVLYAMLPFIVLWLLLFLFAFLHIFLGNKKFTAWYVKLLCWIPAVIWLVLKLFPVLANKFFPDLLTGEQGPLIKAILGGISSGMWISGLCYLLLWIVPIFWIGTKRKIKKVRREQKERARAGYDEYDEDDDYDSDYDDDDYDY